MSGRAPGRLPAPALGGVVLAVALALLPQTARAQSAANAPDWAFGSPAAEGVVAGVTAASVATALLPQRRSAWRPDEPHDARHAADIASDVTGAYVGTALQVAGGWLLEAGYLEGGGAAQPFARAMRTSVIEIEAAALATGITATLKRATGRCRPRSWSDGRCTGGEHDAFPSGHTSPVAAIAGARFVLAARSTGDPTLRLLSFGMAEAATLVTGALRVSAGAHSASDVAAGWAIGQLAGAALAAIHPMVEAPRAAGRPSPAWAGPDIGGAQPSWVWSGRF